MFPGLDETEEIRRVPYTNFRSSALLFGFVRGPQYPVLRATDFSSVTSAVSLGCACWPILDAFKLERNSVDADKADYHKKDRQPLLD
jgi:hypothetical protein